jgi:hypothetical protein
MALLATSQFQKRAQFFWLLIAGQTIFIGLHIHFAFLPLALFLLIWNSWLLFKHHTSKTQVALFLGLVSLNTWVLFNAIKMPTTPSGPPLTPMILIDQIHPLQILIHLINNFKVVTTTLIKIDQLYAALSVVCILMGLFYVSFKYKNLNGFYLLGANLSFILAAYYRYEVYSHYFMPYYLLIIISGCFVASQIRFTFLKLLLVLSYAWLFSQQTFIYFSNPPANDLFHHEIAANIIKADLEKHPGETFTIQGCYENNCDIWSASAIWFFVEKKLEFLKIDNDRKSLALKADDPQIVYIVCHYNSTSCLQLAEKNNFLLLPLGSVTADTEDGI